MPGMSGIELGWNARKINPDIKVLLASGYNGERLKRLQAGLDGFQLVKKPYRTAEIARLLRTAG
jgi:CheY-like chemotaxis protein